MAYFLVNAAVEKAKHYAATQKAKIYVTDEVYNNANADKKRYVHENAREVAERIVQEWENPEGERMIVLKAEMQSGKTSVIRHICYLLNVKNRSKNLKIKDENIHVLCAKSEKILVAQTADKLIGVTSAASTHVSHPTSACWKRANRIKDMSENSVLIVDECHYGAVHLGVIEKMLKKLIALTITIKL
jgi:ATP:corrinoid adenosyltransferase